MNVLSLLALAAAPSAAITFYLYWNDEYEKEPKRLIRKSFLFGIVSILITSVLGAIVYPLLGIDDAKLVSGQSEYSLFHMFVFTFFGVGLVEEFSKWIMIRTKIFRWVNFNEPYDGILYSVMVSLGFATLENVLYIFGSEAAETNGGLITGVLRAFTAVPVHAICGVIMGYYVGKVKFGEIDKTRNMILSFLAPAAFHGAYDFFAFLDWVPGIIAGALVSVLVGLVLAKKAIDEHKQSSPFHPDRISTQSGTDDI
jgi:RsiW-degrading membrane proteinase PrsW (M82 family)